MKYLGVVLLVASIAWLEFFHELSGADAIVCSAEQTKPEAVRYMLLQHLQSHR